MPMVTEIAGSSTVMRATRRVVDVGQRVADHDLGDTGDGHDVPGDGLGRRVLSTPSVTSNSVILALVMTDARPPPHPGDLLALRDPAVVDRISAKPAQECRRIGLVTMACSGASGSPAGGRMCSIGTSNSGSRFSAVGVLAVVRWCWRARAAGGAQRRQVEDACSAAAWSSSSGRRRRRAGRGSSTTSEIRASGRSTLLTTRTTGRCRGQRLAQHERVCGSGPSDASTSSSTHRRPSTGRARPRRRSRRGRGSIDVDGFGSVGQFVGRLHGRVLGQDRDALLPPGPRSP